MKLLYCLKITGKIFYKKIEIINFGKIIGVREAIFSVKIYITLGYNYIKYNESSSILVVTKKKKSQEKMTNFDA